ncbi:MAG: hypothetical protein ACRCZM_03200 [Bacteroidales bacterium]
MADNYLEKQYEDYEARRAAWERERKYGNIIPAVKKTQPKEKSEDTSKEKSEKK